MIRTFAPVLATLLLAGVAPACSGGGDAGVPVATPTVTLSKPAAAIGSPMEMTYRFAVAPDAAALAGDYWVFVHFLDRDGELMWTDDHEPPTPTRQWKAGSTIEYARTMFIPKFPYVGETAVEIGLFSPSTGDRLPLTGTTEGQRAYRVAAFEMRLDSDPLVVVFNDGWYDTEGATDGAGHEWQWSKKEATLSFRNPRRAVRFYLQVDQPAAVFADPQQVDVRLGAAVVDHFALAPGLPALRQIRIPAEQLGQADTVEVTVSVDKTFVPAALPAPKSADPRELGIRVFRAFVEPM